MDLLVFSSLLLVALIMARLVGRSRRHPGSAAQGKRAARPPAVELRGVGRAFPDGAKSVRLFPDTHLKLAPGIHVLLGASGCGKTSLLHIIGGIEAPTEGTVLLDGRRVPFGNARAMAAFRAQMVAWVFQSLNLISHLTVEENAALPLVLGGRTWRSARREVRPLLRRLGLGECMHRRPDTVSGGQRQRVAIVRAFTTSAPVLLADEPTGSLDAQTAAEVMRLLVEQARAEKRTLILVTHDVELCRYADTIHRIDETGLRRAPELSRAQNKKQKEEATHAPV